MSADLSVGPSDLVTLDQLRELGQQLRVDSIGPSTSAGSGHPTSSTGPAIAHLAVSEMPGSGTTEELLDAAGLTAGHIVRAAEALLSQAQPTIALE